MVAFILVTPWFAFRGWFGFVWLDVTAFLRKRNFSRRRLFPQAKSTKKCVSIISCAATCGQFFKLPDVTSAEHHVVGFEGRNQALHGISDIIPPFFLAMLLQSANSNVVLKGALLVRQVSQLHRLDDAIHNHRGPKASPQS